VEAIDAYQVCLCDREPVPSDKKVPLDLRNVRLNHLEMIANGYPFDGLRIYNYRDADLSPLARLNQLTSLQIEWASKVSSIEPLEQLKQLRVLKLVDLPRVHDLTPLSQLSKLEHLEVSGGIWKRMKISTIRWITRLSKLQSLALRGLVIEDDDITLISELPLLKKLNLANTWPMEQFAHLFACLGSAIEFPQPEMELLDVECGKCGARKVMLIGRRKPTLCPVCHVKRLELEKRKFNEAIEAARITSGRNN
jgi:hypothetical protein